MLRYYKLFDLLNRREMKKTDLLEVISPPTLAKLGKGKNINSEAIDKICNLLRVQPGDIMECIYDEEDSPDEEGTIKKVLLYEDSELVADERTIHKRNLPENFDEFEE